MSTYGGDSWVPEAMRRNQLVDQLLADAHDIHDTSQVRRLSNGRLACLVCPHRPVLDTFPVLIMHRKGAKHRAAALQLQEKEFRLQDEIQKRAALSALRESTQDIVGNLRNHQCTSGPTCSPLVEATRKRTAQALGLQNVSQATSEAELTRDSLKQKRICQDAPLLLPRPSKSLNGPRNVAEVLCSPSVAVKRQDADTKNRQQGQNNVFPSLPVGSKEDQNWQKERERQLRLREAGWRLDGNGKWFREEHVEFDSDEEVPDDLS